MRNASAKGDEGDGVMELYIYLATYAHKATRSSGLQIFAKNRDRFEAATLRLTASFHHTA